MTFQERIRARTRAHPRKIVFPEGEDDRILDAVPVLLREGLCHPVLLGDPDRVAQGLRSRGVKGDVVEVVAPWRLDDAERYVDRALALRRSKGMDAAAAREAVADPLSRGALMVALGEVDGSVAGVAHATGDVILAAIRYVGTADGIRVVSSSFYLEVPPFRGEESEVLTFTDPAVNPEPSAEELAHIALAAAEARRKVVGDSPVVAFLSYSTKGSASGPSVDRVKKAVELFRDMAPGIPADGEFQVDTALVEAVARRKAPASAVGGAANVLVFPDLNSANIAYKLVERLAGAPAMGPILQGLAHPCNDLSRGASAEDVVAVACITGLMA